MSSAVKILLITEADPARVLALYDAAGWVDAEDEGTWINAMLRGSCFAAGAFAEDGTLVGMARVLSDNVSDAIIQDVVVDPAFRKQGIGGDLVRFLVARLRERGVDWIGLISAPGTRAFYEELGFRTLENHTPMRYREEENS